MSSPCDTFHEGLIDLCGGNRSDAKFGRNRIDAALRNIEVNVTVGSEVRTDVTLIEAFRLFRPKSVEEAT